MQPSHSTHSGRGNQSLRGGGRGTFGRHGRERSRGRGKPPSGSSATTVAAPGKPPPQKARCELCKVDCNTLEILEQHKNGKKHKKNLKVHEELQTLSRQRTAVNPQMTALRSNPENVASNKPEGSASKPASAEAQAEGASGNDETPRTEPSSGAPPSEKSVRTDRLIGRGGFKRSMRGGRGGKLMKAHDGSKRPVEPLKPRLGFPFICELCNVKCECQVVYESHIAGKKHLTNAKRFQGIKGALGGGLQALYPSIPNVASTSIVPQVHQQGPQDAQALASMILSQQDLQDPQAAQAALAQLLNQHGIHDAQTLFVQLIPYLLAQSQASGLFTASVAGFRMVDAQNPQSQGLAFPAGAGSQTAVTESGPQHQNVTANAEIEQGMQQNDTSDYGKSLDKPIERASENNNVGSEQVPSASTKEEQAVSEQEKQSSRELRREE